MAQTRFSGPVKSDNGFIFGLEANGNVFVRPTFGENLSQLHDVRITNPQNGDVLKYNATGGYWYNAAP